MLAHKLHCCWNCSQHPLNRGYASNWPWRLSGVVFTRPPVQIISQDCSSRVPGLTVVAVVAAQILAWSNPRVYVPTKPTAAKTRPVSATGALVHLDVPQLLSLQCRQRGCKSVVPAASRRDFSSSSLVALPLGLSCGFSPTSVCVPPTGICSSGCPRAHAATQVGGGGGGDGWGMRACSGR